MWMCMDTSRCVSVDSKKINNVCVCVKVPVRVSVLIKMYVWVRVPKRKQKNEEFFFNRVFSFQWVVRRGTRKNLLVRSKHTHITVIKDFFVLNDQRTRHDHSTKEERERGRVRDGVQVEFHPSRSGQKKSTVWGSPRNEKTRSVRVSWEVMFRSFQKR